MTIAALILNSRMLKSLMNRILVQMFAFSESVLFNYLCFVGYTNYAMYYCVDY